MLKISRTCCPGLYLLHAVISAQSTVELYLSRPKTVKNKSPAVAKKETLQPIQFLLQYWLSRLSKVNDFHVIWKAICDFPYLLVTNSNLGPSLTVSEITPVFHWKTHILPPPHPRTEGRQTTTMPKTPYSLAVSRQKPQNTFLDFKVV